MPKSKPESRSTFKSYIGDNGSNSAPENNGPTSVLVAHQMENLDVNNSLSHGMALEPRLLPGELVIARAVTVVQFVPYSERTQGISGTLFCTNFKLTFVSADKDPDESLTCMGERNKLIGEDDIALTNIDTVYQVSNTKRKKLSPGASISGSVKNLEIHCKDFRIHTFNFKCTPKQEAKVIAHAVVHHAFPTRHELLFALDFKCEIEPGRSEESIPRFRIAEDWDRELERLNVQTYRTTVCNSAFRLCQAMPECFVVPTGLTNADITAIAPQFVGYRPPCWSYTCPNGSSLVRMAYLMPETTQTHLEEKCIDAIQAAHCNSNKVKVYDLGQVLPSLQDMQASFTKLCELCMPVSLNDVWESDSKWYSRLDKTDWLQYVTQCLKVSLRVADVMMQKEQSVILRENEARDMCAVIASLTQLLLDPELRTQAGFQRLLEKEWVVLGHKFVDRCGLLADRDSEQSPVFLMFLDSVWQLLQQFPSAFQFSETYLTILWDSVCLGLFEQFVFNCEHERTFKGKRYSTHGPSHSPHSLMSVWQWDHQFDKDHLSLCNNPLYLTKTELQLNLARSTSLVENATGHADDPLLINKFYAKKLVDIYESAPQEDSFGYLRPVLSCPLIMFWSHLYLRWLAPVQIVAGGSPSEYLHQCILVEEIICLQHKIEAIQKAAPFNKANRRSSDLYFSFNVIAAVKTPLTSTKRKWSEVLTSSFPFSPSQMPSKVSFLGTPISLFFEHSMLMDDSESIDGLSDPEPEDTSILNSV